MLPFSRLQYLYACSRLVGSPCRRTRWGSGVLALHRSTFSNRGITTQWAVVLMIEAPEDTLAYMHEIPKYRGDNRATMSSWGVFGGCPRLDQKRRYRLFGCAMEESEHMKAIACPSPASANVGTHVQMTSRRAGGRRASAYETQRWLLFLFFLQDAPNPKAWTRIANNRHSMFSC